MLKVSKVLSCLATYETSARL